MNHGFDFDRGFQDIKKMAEGVGEFLRDIAEEAGVKDFDFSFDRNYRPSKPAQPTQPFEFAGFSSPRANVYHTDDDSLVFEFLLPGFDESQISLSFKGDLMILKARRPASAQSPEGVRFDRRGFGIKDIDRKEFSVPADRYDHERVKAVLRNGVLTVTVPEKSGPGGMDGFKIEIIKEGN